MAINDDDLADIYQSLPKEKPADSLDNSILALAKKQTQQSGKTPYQFKWYWGGGVAASLLVAVLLVDMTPQDRQLVEPTSMSSPTVQVDVLSRQQRPEQAIARPFAADVATESVEENPIDLTQADRLLASITKLKTFTPETASLAAKTVAQRKTSSQGIQKQQTALFEVLIKIKQQHPTFEIPQDYLQVLTDEQIQQLNNIESTELKK